MVLVGVESRASRPPGFGMSYRPDESVYLPPHRARAASYVYVGLAVAAVVLVVVGENSGSNSWLFDFVVAQDRGRWMSARTFAIVLVVGAVASVLRSSMRGIRVYEDGLETREVAYGFLPKVRRFRWPQLERIVLDQQALWIELWDGQRAKLPAVADREGLVCTLERVAASRDIRVQGGRGLDELPEQISNQKEEP